LAGNKQNVKKNVDSKKSKNDLLLTTSLSNIYSTRFPFSW
jgi:hypothetical protein